jgi:chitinase
MRTSVLCAALFALFVFASAQLPTQWQAGTSYQAGARVIFNNVEYTCLQSHTSLPGWEPTVAHSLWQQGGVANGAVPARPAPVPAAPAPTPAAAAPAPAPASGGGVVLPRHLLMGYWQNFNNGATCLRLKDVPSSYTIIAASFADSTSRPGEITYATDSGLSACLGGYTDADFRSDMQIAHSKGQKVVVSVGGQNGNVDVSDAASAALFANSVLSLMRTFGFDGVDIDLEHGINPTYMSQALHNVAAQAPGVVITMAPETLYMSSASQTYFQLALAIKDILTMCNTQYYNSGSMLGPDGRAYSQGTLDFLTALAAVQLQGGLRANQIGLGLPATPSAAGGGYMAPSVVASALTCLTRGTGCGSFVPSTTYPDLRGAMTWSVNWDASNGWAWANTVAAALRTLP